MSHIERDWITVHRPMGRFDLAQILGGVGGRVDDAGGDVGILGPAF